MFSKSTSNPPESIPYYSDVVTALAEPGCSLCRLLDRDADRYIDSLLWDMVNDPKTREELNRARGYCRHHAWMLDRKGSALGVTIIMQGVLKVVGRILDADIERRRREGSASLWSQLRTTVEGSSKELTSQLTPRSACPICVENQVNERHYATVLLKYLHDEPTLAPQFRQSDGLCLNHLQNTLARSRSNSAAAELVDAQRAILLRLDAELSEFIRKNDHRFRHETFGSEEDAWIRALETVSGSPSRRGHDAALTQAIR